MKILVLLLLSITTYAKTFTYDVRFDAFMESEFSTSELKDLDSLIKAHINYSVGSMSNNLSKGDRRALNPKYNISNIKIFELDGKTRINYQFDGTLLSEKSDLNFTKIALPIDVKNIYKRANIRRSNCSRQGFKNIERSFYWSWSPYYRKCKLKKRIDYIEVEANLSLKSVNNKYILNQEMVLGGEFNSFIYLGSDFHSMRTFGYAKEAYTKFRKTIFQMGFRKRSDLDDLEQIIFSKDYVKSYFKVYSKLENGIKSNVYIMLGNPTDHTPEAKKEFFDFIRYGIENGSYIHYAGHAGLGSILDFSKHEEKYNKKIHYPDHYQVFYYDACNTYFHSSKFLSLHKNQNQKIDFFSNGLSIGTNLAFPVLKQSFLSIYKNVTGNEKLEVNEFVESVNSNIKPYFYDSKDFPMLNHQRL